MIVLLAAPKANDYYPKLGFEYHPRTWILKGGWRPAAPDRRSRRESPQPQDFLPTLGQADGRIHIQARTTTPTASGT